MKRPFLSQWKNLAGFARADLVCALLFCSLIGCLTSSGQARRTGKSNLALCQNNARQLTKAWQTYANDHDGRLVLNQTLLGQSWVAPAEESATDLKSLEEGLLWPYLKNSPQSYRCPADRNGSQIEEKPRVRSFSMNILMGNSSSSTGNPWVYTRKSPYSNQSQIQKPAEAFVFIGEHRNSIDDGGFWVDPDNAHWIDLPGPRHLGKEPVSYADGSVESRHWTDPAILSGCCSDPCGNQSLNSPDLAWLQARTGGL
ncbi:MAG: hypothetical protein SFY81_11970 [Verrucomicrobiota bacterium]|nr:hypothetical protein [Verrucomicrobiota bacterium]